MYSPLKYIILFIVNDIWSSEQELRSVFIVIRLMNFFVMVTIGVSVADRDWRNRAGYWNQNGSISTFYNSG